MPGVRVRRGMRGPGRAACICRAGCRSGRSVRSPAFESVVGVQVDLGRCGALVSQPQRDREDVDVSDAQEHRDTGTKRGQCAAANGASPRCPRWQRPARTCDGCVISQRAERVAQRPPQWLPPVAGNQIPHLRLVEPQPHEDLVELIIGASSSSASPHQGTSSLPSTPRQSPHWNRT